MFFKKSILVACLVALATYTVNVSAVEFSTRIINGPPAGIAQVPYIVQLRDDGGKQFCGGTLVSSRHVVTASHCFNDRLPQRVAVVGGASTVREAGLARRIQKLWRHPEYTPTTQHSDVAVILLDKPMTGPNMIPVQLCQQPLLSNALVQVSGWGRTVEAIHKGSHQLRTVQIPVRSFDVCYREFSQAVQKNMFCASGKEDKGTCIGDSGGPAIYSGQLCGIVAFGRKCGMVGYTGAFSDVYSLRSFIEGAMRG